MWAPLPLHEAPAAPPPEEIAFSDGHNTNYAHDEVVRRVTSLYEYPTRQSRAVGLLTELAANRLSARSAELVAAALDDFEQGFQAMTLRARHDVRRPAPEPWLPRAATAVPTPFLPDERDGLTAAQRRLIEVLAAVAPNHLGRVELLERVGATEEHERALSELLLPRPYPLVLAHSASRYRLSPLAMEMIDRLSGGGVQVHGGFFPNLLVNGCAEPLAFPTHHLREVVEASKLIARWPGSNELSLMSRLPGPDFAWPVACAQPRRLYETGEGQLDIGTLITFESLRVVQLERFVPGVSPSQVVAAISEGVARGALAGVVRVSELGSEAVRYEVEQPAYARAVLRHLDARSMLMRSYVATLSFRSDTGAPATGWIGHLLQAFFNRTRLVIAHRLVAQEKALRAQLDQLSEWSVTPAVQRVIDRVLDVSLDHAEAVWALTRLGTEEFVAHPVFKGVATDGVAPLSEPSAQRALRATRTRSSSNRSEAERDSLTSRIDELEARLRSPGLLHEEVCSQLDLIVGRYATAPRRTLFRSRASLLALLHLR
ncbi:MAG: hypothetical protein JNJ54_21850 [Myxococcaceae bacterium]|nr:hypothetical protein [Myxococcaceae bacterium]